MNKYIFATLRLGKTSVADIRRIDSTLCGVQKSPYLIDVVCTQVPSELSVGTFVFIWLGSDNSKGISTAWKQGFKAFGKVTGLKKGANYNAESTTTVEILYVFKEAVNRLDILREAPQSYYWCSSLPIIGLDDHSNQTIRMLDSSIDRGDIKAFFNVLEQTTPYFKEDMLSIDKELSLLFDYKLLNPKTNEPTENNDTTHKQSSILPLQQIYYGAPGTGKSHTINEQTEGEEVIRTTFHPDSDYSTFVGAYKPTMGLLPICDELGQPMKIGSTVLHKEQIVYEFVDQAFLQAYIQAWKFYAENAESVKKQYLIIEEINRGNCAQIFGDLFQLLDRNDYGFSVYPINADKDMKKQLAKAFKGLSIDKADSINQHYKDRDVVKEVLEGEILLLPDNLYIWATMNTSDQSLFPIDSAFKRRWEWQYMPIGKGYDKSGEEIKWAIEGETKKYSWWSFLEKINAQIGEATQSEDKKLGFFFCKGTDGVISAEKFVGKVIFYLWNDVFKNNGFEGPIFKDTDGTELSFAKFYDSDTKGNAIVKKDKVELFLKNLGVEVVGEENDALEAAITGGTVDRSSYSFNGKGKYGKSDLGRTIMESYLNQHPQLTFEQIKQTFPDSMLNGVAGPGLIVEENVDLASYIRYYRSGYTSADGIKFSIYKQWTIGNIPNIIKFAETQNWVVEKL